MRRVGWLAVVLLFAACNGELGTGSLTFKARFPDHVRFTHAPSAYQAKRLTDGIAISTVRLTAIREGRVEATRDFDAAAREGELVNLTEGVYEIRVEGLAGDTLLLRGTKTGVVVESAQVRDAGEFLLAPVTPATPVLSVAPASVTNAAELVLTGAKEMFTGIKVNGTTLVEINDAKTFTAKWALFEGRNTIDVTAFNAENTEGPKLTFLVTYDKTAPKANSFTLAGSPAAVSSATLKLLVDAEGADQMMVSLSSSFARAQWLPYEPSLDLTLNTPDGATTLYIKFRDAAGNESAVLSTSVVLDRVAPPTPELFAPALSSSYAVNVTLTGSGATFMEYWESGRPEAITRVPFAQNLAVTLSAGDGAKQINLRLGDAAGNLSPAAKATVTLDTTPPSSTAIGIAGGATYLRSLVANLDLSALDATEMQVAADPAFSGAAWEPFSAVKTLAFTAADGSVTFYARFRDAAGNISTPVSVTATLDTAAPTGSVAVAGAPAAVSTTAITLALTASADVAEMLLADEPAFATAVWQPYNAAPAFTLAAGDGAKTIYAKFKDAAGNVSPSAVQTSLTLDQTAPVPVLITANASPVSSTTVSLTVSATGATEMQLANDLSFAGASWLTYATAPSFDIPGGDGLKTIFVRFRDSLGNTSSVLSTGVTLDTTAPGAPSVVVSGSPAAVSAASITLDIAATGSPVQVQVSQDSLYTGAPWQAFAATIPFTITGGAGTKTIYARFRDAAGNTSGSSWTTISFDDVAPSVSLFEISGNPQYVGSAAVTLNISATDNVYATDLQISQDVSFAGAPWVAQTPTTAYTLTGGDGVKSIYVRARDAAGNVSDSWSTSVTLDTLPPVVNVFEYSGTPAAVNTLQHQVDIDVTDLAPLEMRFAADAGFVANPAWQPYAVSFLSPLNEGVNTVYGQFRDAAGNVSNAGPASIVLDTGAPSGVGTLTVNPSPSTGTFALSWGAATDSGVGMNGYLVEESADQIAWFSAGTTTETSLSLVRTDGLYYFRVSAFDLVGNQGPYSSSVQQTIDSLAPTGGFVYDGLSSDIAFSADAGSFSVNWLNFWDETAIVNYEVGLGTSPGLDDVVAFLPAGVTTAQTLPATLTDGVLYYATVRAIDGAGNFVDVSSDGFTVDTQAPGVPGTPSSFPSPATGTFDVSWSASSDAGSGLDYYELEEIGLTTYPVTGTSFTKLTPADGAYSFRVRAKDAAGNFSPWSVSATTLVDALAPTIPGGFLFAANPTTGPVTLTWLASTDGAGSGVQDYLVSVSPDAIAWTQLGATAATTYTALLTEGYHYFMVEARDVAGNVSAGGMSLFVYVDQTAPAGGIVNDGPGADIDWSASATVAEANWSSFFDDQGISRYEWALGTTPGGEEIYAFTDVGLNSFVSQTGLSLLDGTTYYASVRASDAAGNTASASSNGFTVDSTPPSAPGAITFSANPVTNQVTISWGAATDTWGIRDYVLSESADAGASWAAVATTTATSLVRLLADGAYQYRVRARDLALNEGPDSTVSAVLNVTSTGPTSPYITGPAAVSSTTVPVIISAVGATEYQLSADAGFTGAFWSGMVSATTFDVTAGDGAKTIYARFRNGGGALSSVTSTTVMLDTAAPFLGSVLLASGMSAVSQPTAALDLSAGGDSFEMSVTGDVIPPKGAWQPFNANLSITLATATGIQTMDLLSGTEVVNAVVVQPDGKIVAVGNTSSGLGDILVMRLEANGKPDPTFNLTGKRVIDIGSVQNYAYAVTLQSDGKIVIAGSTNDGMSQNFLLLRLNTNGSSDTSFDLDGVASYAVGTGSNIDEATAVAMQSDGKIVAGGYVMNATQGYNFVLMRLDTFGALDTSFASVGYTELDVQASLNDIVRAIVIQPDGKILAAGQSGNGTNNDFALVRFLSTGTQETAFGPGGKTLTAFSSGNDEAYAMRLQADGKIVLAGRMWNGTNYDYAVARYLATGPLDTTFDLDGMFSFAAGAGNDQANALEITAKGYIVAGQAGNATGDVAVVAINANGGLDNGFGAGGTFTYNSVNADNGKALAKTSMDRIVVAGSANPSGTDDAFIARLWADGKLDESFGGPKESVKRVYVRVRDAVGNVSSPVFGSVMFDATPPGTPGLAIQGSPAYVNNTNVTLVFTAAGATQMRFGNQADLSGQAWVGFVTTQPYTLAAGGDGTRTVFAQYRDDAGNQTATVSAGTILDTQPPTSTSINAPATTSTANITLNLTATGASEMHISEASDFSTGAWEPFATVKSGFLLSGGDGAKTIYARFRDLAGNVSANVFTTTQLTTLQINSLSAAAGYGGDVLTITGFGFNPTQGAGYVNFGASLATVQSWSDTSITIVLPASEGPSTYNISVVTSDARFSNSVLFGLKPRIDSLGVTNGIGGAILHLSGTNFGATAGQARFGATNVSIASWSMSGIDVTVPTNLQFGAYAVSVTAGGQGSNALSFTIDPSLGAATPSQAVAGDTVTVSGNNLGDTVAGYTLYVDGQATIIDGWSMNSLSFRVPGSAVGGPADVMVDFGGPTATTYSAITIGPKITSLAPASGRSADTITISGSGFGASQGASTITVGGVNVTAFTWSATSVQFDVPANVGPGSHAVTIDAFGMTSTAVTLTVSPSLSSVLPTSDNVGALVSVYGENFGSTEGSVTVGGATATVSSWTMSAISIWVPDPGMYGSQPVVVTAGGYSSAELVYFDITQPLSVSPVTTSVPINGQVQFTATNGVPPYSWAVVSGGGAIGSSTGMYTAPSTIGTATVRVTDMNLMTADATVNIVMPPTPVISSVSPAAAAPGAIVSISGTGFGEFQGAGAVYIGKYALETVDTWSDSAISFTLPAGLEPGATPIRVESAARLVSASEPFENQTAWIGGRYPHEGTAGTLVTLTGQYFGAVSGSVTVQTEMATIVSWSTTQIQFVVPVGVPSGDRPIMVNTAESQYPQSRFTQRGAGQWIAFDEVPQAREDHTAVWTGAEMIVWGGYLNAHSFGDGGRYNPATDSWMPMPAGPSGRRGHTAVWTGREMIIFGGEDSTATLATSHERYNPWTNSWAPVGYFLSNRRNHVAAFTGREMYIWGGYDIGLASDGARYNPATDIWTSMTVSGAPAGRVGASAVWTGKALIVFGGADAVGSLGDGARYDPQSDSWTMLPTLDAPQARLRHTAVWTGTDMLVWGGYQTALTMQLNDGAAYNPQLDTWSPLPIDGNTPAAREAHTAVWTGDKMLIWGGFDGAYPLTGGAAFHTTNSTWTPISALGAPSMRAYHTAVFTGDEMIVWGGNCEAFCQTNTGGRYNVAANTWQPTFAGDTGLPVPRMAAGAVWTGAEMILWGGEDLMSFHHSGARYVPATNTWLAMSAVSAPASAAYHAMVWTGTEVVVWGGYDSLSNTLGTGGRYHPGTDSWTSMSISGSPSLRIRPAASWTGSEVVIWGGSFSGYYGDGAKYDPVGDAWTPITAASAPAPRALASAVWTGTHVIVWGGFDTIDALSTGSRYDPVADTWAPVTTTTLAGRFEHSAVWTGSEMIVWGGRDSSSNALSDGARYDPVGDAWTPVNAFAPAARFAHATAWTGSEMLVFSGGTNGATPFNDLWRYVPGTDSWFENMPAGPLTPRKWASAVWTGTEMVVVGGSAEGTFFNSGARFQP